MKVQFVLMALEIVYFVFLGQGLEEQWIFCDWNYFWKYGKVKGFTYVS
jgi:hypothetical protein